MIGVRTPPPAHMAPKHLAPPRRAPIVRLDAGYLASLDGLRALAVSAVLLFHLDLLPGGNLGVDAFFVLSGWLITTRLLAEADRAHGPAIDLPRFWGARIRRLMPASLAVILTVTVVWAAAGINVPSLSHDVTWALAWSSNWGTIEGGNSYWARFGEPSPITHFWSLAIEEQFYLLWPLVIVLVVRAGGPQRRAWLRTLSVALAVGSVAFMVASYDAARPTATYLNSFARAHTLLIGAAAATLTISARRRQRAGRPPGWGVGLAVAVAVGIMLASDQGSSWLYLWGFPAFAVALAVIVVAAAAGAGAPLLASPPLRWIGDRSYGIYLWHWPIFLLLSPRRMPMDGAVLDVLRVSISVGVAAASYRWIEMPIRSRQRLTAPWAPGVAAGALAGAFALVAIVPTTAVDRGPSTPVTLPPVAAGAPARPGEGGHGSPQAVANVTPPLPQRVLVAGDSTAMQLADTLMFYAGVNPDELLVGTSAFPGCGLTAATDGRLHEFSSPDGSAQLIDLSGCARQWTSVVERVRSSEQIDVVVVDVTSWDGIDIHLPDGRTVSVLDPSGRQMVAEAYERFVAEVEGAGARVVWITPPDVHLGWGTKSLPMNDPRRWIAMREIVDALPVEQVDLHGWLLEGGFDTPQGRPDGVHLNPDLNTDFVINHVVPALLTLP